MAKVRYLTKSRYKLARECPTKLFYTGKKDKYEDQSLDDPFLRALACGGFQVGELAKIYHPGGHMIDTLSYSQAIEQTYKLLEQENVTIYEPAFLFENLFVRIDVLVKRGTHVKIIEVKSKSFDPNDEDPFYDKRALKKGQKKLLSKWTPYLEDVAFQTYVVKKARPEYVCTPYLMLADKSKQTSISGLNQKFLLSEDDKGRTSVVVKPGTTIDSVGDKILITVPVSEEVSLIHDGESGKTYEDVIKGYEETYQKDIKLTPVVGTHCKSCQFRSDDPERSGFHECWKDAANLSNNDLQQPLVLDVWNFRKAKKLIENGTYLMKDVTREDVAIKESNSPGLSNSERQWIQIEAATKGTNKPYIDREGLATEILNWTFPLHFIDFETTMIAIPFNAGRRPYEQIAFQFSHHQLNSDGSIEHKGQYINQEVGAFPNFDFLRALKRELENDSGTIFRYANHENTVLCQIYDQLAVSDEPDREFLQAWIRTVTDSKSESRGKWEGTRSMIDMCELIKRYYYHPMTNGSNSIKKVLPATLYESKSIKERYSQPIYGSRDGIKSLNYTDWTWVQFDEKGNVIDPYRLLPQIFNGVETDKLDLLVGSDELADGGAAMMAYAKMQFTEMSQAERRALTAALLKYCELDTFAMVLLYEHWAEITQTKLGQVA